MEDQIVAAIRRIIRAVDVHSRRLSEAHGLTGPQLATLQAAARLEESACTGTLAREVHLSGPTVTGIVDRLEKGGLVERTRSGNDRRSVQISLTERGHAVLADAPSLLQDRFRSELAKVADWERTMILATLQRIGSMMDAESIDASPLLVQGPIDAQSPAASPTATDGERASSFDSASLETPPACAGATPAGIEAARLLT